MMSSVSACTVLSFCLRSILYSVLLVLGAGAFWLINVLVISPFFDPLKYLPGPDATFFENHFRQVMDPELSPDTHAKWTRSYGKTFRFHGFGKFDFRLMSFDHRVLAHVLSNPIYEKPPQTKALLGQLLGRGVFTREGAEHRLQRHIIGPAFTTQAVRRLTPVFFQKAAELRDRWESIINTSSPLSLKPSEMEKQSSLLDVCHWLSRATFDAFGAAGFDYQFNAIDGESEKLYSAFRMMFDMVDKKSVLRLLLPILDTIKPDDVVKTTERCLAVIHETGRDLLNSKRSLILAGGGSSKGVHDKDILSLLIKSNLSSDPAKRLSDSDLLDQLTSFLFTGSDSTAIAMSWCLHLLSENSHIQSTLRDEIISAPPSTPTDSGYDEYFPEAIPSFTPEHYDAIDKLPLLDAVIRETLRLCPPVHGTLRVATADDCIPVSHPVTLKDGKIVHKGEFIRIRKGSFVQIPIEGLNLDTDVWGVDAREFRPERWFSLPSAARPPAFPGLANVMSFSFGPHSCPGYKFTIAEMKIILVTLLREFSFSSVEGQQISKSNGILVRPFVKGQRRQGYQLPLVVRRMQD